MSMQFFATIPLEELRSTHPTKCSVDGLSVLVVKDEKGSIFAFENNCSHADKPLERGIWNPVTREMTCPFHKAVFDVAQNGIVKVGPAVVSLQVYGTEVREHQGKQTVYVGIDSED